MGTRLASLVVALLAAGAVSFADEPPAAGVVFGTAHPGLVEAVDPAGTWIVVCQARADTNHDGRCETFLDMEGGAFGDDLVAYLVVGGGEGTAIDALLGVDPNHRFVVGAPKGHVTLYDTRTKTAVDLTPKAAKEGESTSVEPWVSFDDAGRRLLTARVHGAGETAVTRLVVRDLESGVETSLDPGPGLLVRAALSGDGRSIDETVVTEDTDRNGKIEAPRRRTSQYGGTCGGPWVAAWIGPWSGDKPTHRVYAVDGSLRRDAPGFVCFVGRRWVRRLGDGSLVLEAPAGEPVTIAAADLKAKVLASDDASGIVLLASSMDTSQASLFAAGPSGVRDLGVRLALPRHFPEGRRNRGERISRLLESERIVFDWSKGAVVAVPGRLVTSEGAHALMLRERSLVVVDVDSGTETSLPGRVESFYGQVWRAGSFAALSGLVIDLAQAKVVGTYEFRPYSVIVKDHSLRDDGALLRSDGACPWASEWSAGATAALPCGPFRWEAPTPPK
jgi:hypothetical protein